MNGAIYDIPPKDCAAEGILWLIDDGGYRPGDRLPPERELCERIGVSRTALRSAIAVLVSRGVLESRQGSGTYLRPAKPVNVFQNTYSFSSVVRAAGLVPLLGPYTPKRFPPIPLPPASSLSKRALPFSSFSVFVRLGASRFLLRRRVSTSSVFRDWTHLISMPMGFSMFCARSTGLISFTASSASRLRASTAVRPSSWVSKKGRPRSFSALGPARRTGCPWSHVALFCCRAGIALRATEPTTASLCTWGRIG